MNWFAIDGTCELLLPPGCNTVSFSQNPFWTCEKHDIESFPGQLAARFIPHGSTSKKIDMLEIDMGCTGMSPDVACFEGKASGLDLVQLIHDALEENPYPSMIEFSGSMVARNRDSCSVQVNSRNQGGHLGVLSLLDCHRPVFPLTLSDTAFSEWSLSDWWKQCHRKRGLVIWSDTKSRDDPDFHGEALAGILTKGVDAFECVDLETERNGGISLWMDLLSLGLAPPLVGGSGTRNPQSFPGKTRTMVFFGNQHWVEAVRAGRSSVTTGPIVDIALNGIPPGGSIKHGPDGVFLTARCHSAMNALLRRGVFLDMVGADGFNWNFRWPESDYLETPVPLPPNCGKQIAVRLVSSAGKLIMSTSPFTVSDSTLDSNDSSRLARVRLLKRLDETSKKITGDPRHADRREQVVASIMSAIQTITQRVC